MTFSSKLRHIQEMLNKDEIERSLRSIRHETDRVKRDTEWVIKQIKKMQKPKEEQ